ncbi:TRAP-type C4-dicarboxylate transport system, small permease component [Cognatiyoonia sediminum]|uniref:TRAP transporter small permease protein n=1 Tax=Cognatiyoonia sediminum TaxID=1508389 RepID=A0A1M5MN95_9RHOB|nr:TRAP transporter small permease [Cognatiyoonia sediminum]SHG78706.1 TRAP-type C4-dicarboxylate transport system, small permease component [Cognatiyoonia sediminum]
MSIWSDAATIVNATLSGDINFKVVQAYRSNGAWLVFAPLTLIGAVILYYRERLAERLEERRGKPTTSFTHPIIALFLTIALVAAFWDPFGSWLETITGGYQRVILIGVPVILVLFERTPERTIVVYSYIVMAAIIFIGVIQRFGFNAQVPWSTTIPPLLFMIMAWYGAVLNVRLRTHLSFSEFRTKMKPKGQMFWLTFDNVLWLIFCIIVVTTTARATVNTYDNFAIVLGTDDIMRWWFMFTMPLCFILLATRAIENMIEDLGKYRSGAPMIEQAVIGGDT